MRKRFRPVVITARNERKYSALLCSRDLTNPTRVDQEVDREAGRNGGNRGDRRRVPKLCLGRPVATLSRPAVAEYPAT